MAYLQGNPPPPNKILTFTLQNFVGGFNNRSQQLDENEASDVLNMMFSDDTVMEKRKGTTTYDTLHIKDANGNGVPITYIDEFKPYNDANQLIRATDNEVYAGSTKILSTSGRIHGTNFKGKYYFSDGAKMFVYGIFPQSDSDPHVDVIGTVDAGYTTMEIVNPPSGFTPLDTTHTEGVWKYDYTNLKAWYEPCQNEIDDEYKGSNVLPSNPKYTIVRDGRMYVSGSSEDNDNVFITDIQNPYYFPVYLPIQMPPNSDKVTGLAVYDDAVIVGRQHDVHAIHGKTNNPNLGEQLFKLSRLNTHTGFANQQSVNRAHNYLFFIGYDGNAYSLASSHLAERVLSTTILSKSIDLKKEPFNFTSDDIHTATTHLYDDFWYVSIKGYVLVYSYRHRAWTVYNNLQARSFYNVGSVMIWGRADGQTAKFSSDYLDFNLPFRAYWISRYFDMDEANYFKFFREFYLVAHTYRDYRSDVNVTFQIDYANVKGAHRIKNEIAVFGKAKWGERFINRNIVASLPFVLGRRGRSVKFVLSNGYFKDGEVATYSDLDAYPGKEDGTLVYVQDEGNYYLYQDLEWHKRTLSELDQTMKIYEVNGDYELRGRR